MELTQTLSLMLGSSWAAGLNLYAAILMIGGMGAAGQIDLPQPLEILQNPLVLVAAAVLYLIEFFADKIPGLDSLWDGLHTFIRIPAGAMLASGAASGLDMGGMGEMMGLLLGGGVAASTHAVKSGSRVMINTSPEPFSNWTASVSEDIAAFSGVWAALNHPYWFFAGFVVFILFLIWILPKIWRGIKKVFAFISRLFGSKDEPDPPNNKEKEKE